MIDKLKKRWGVNSPVQVIIILIVFALTGMTAVYIKKPIFHYLGAENIQSTALYVLLYIITVLPAYQVLLLFYGFIFGQFKFFWAFEQRMFSRISKLFR